MVHSSYTAPLVHSACTEQPRRGPWREERAAPSPLRAAARVEKQAVRRDSRPGAWRPRRGAGVPGCQGVTREESRAVTHNGKGLARPGTPGTSAAAGRRTRDAESAGHLRAAWRGLGLGPRPLWGGQDGATQGEELASPLKAAGVNNVFMARAAAREPALLGTLCAGHGVTTPSPKQSP